MYLKSFWLIEILSTVYTILNLDFGAIGISVRVAGDEASTNNDELASCGDKSTSTNSLMHNKYCIIDGESDVGVLITGSLNWTFSLSKSFY